MKKIKEDSPTTTSGNIGTLPENPPTGSFKIRHGDNDKRIKGKLGKVVIRTPYKN